MTEENDPNGHDVKAKPGSWFRSVLTPKVLGGAVVVIVAPLLLAKTLPWVGLELTAAPPFFQMLKERFLDIEIDDSLVLKLSSEENRFVRRFTSASPLTIKFRYTLDEILTIQNLRISLAVAGTQDRNWRANLQCNPDLTDKITLSDEVYRTRCTAKLVTMLSLKPISSELQSRFLRHLSNWGTGWRMATNSILTLSYSTATQGKESIEAQINVLAPPSEEFGACQRSKVPDLVHSILDQKGKIQRSKVKELVGEPISFIQTDDPIFGALQEGTYLCSDVSELDFPTCTFGMSFDASGTLVDGWSDWLDDRALGYFEARYLQKIEDLSWSSRAEVTSRLGKPHFSIGSSDFYVLPEAPESQLYELRFLVASRWLMFQSSQYSRNMPHIPRTPCSPRASSVDPRIREELSELLVSKQRL